MVTWITSANEMAKIREISREVLRFNLVRPTERINLYAEAGLAPEEDTHAEWLRLNAGIEQ